MAEYFRFVLAHGDRVWEALLVEAADLEPEAIHQPLFTSSCEPLR